MIEYRTICRKCGACAGHPEDRVNGACHHCGSLDTREQFRSHLVVTWTDVTVFPVDEREL